jgi:hypothetical protein
LLGQTESKRAESLIFDLLYIIQILADGLICYDLILIKKREIKIDK